MDEPVAVSRIDPGADVLRRAVVTGAVVGLVAVGTRIPPPFLALSAAMAQAEPART